MFRFFLGSVLGGIAGALLTIGIVFALGWEPSEAVPGADRLTSDSCAESGVECDELADGDEVASVPVGEDGLDGADGAEGPPGASGPQGPQGLQGPQGDPGVVDARSPLVFDSDRGVLLFDEDELRRIPRLSELIFDGAGVSSPVPRGLSWNDTAQTLDLVLGDGDVTLQLGQESVQRVSPSGSSDLLNGRAVRIAGGESDYLLVEYVQPADTTKNTNVLGVLTEDIAAGGTGFVTTQGLVRDVNTSAFTLGDRVYSSTDGVLTTTRPTLGAVIEIGVVVFVGATNGAIYVDVTNTFIPGPGLPCEAGPELVEGTYKWEEDGKGDFFLVCDVKP